MKRWTSIATGWAMSSVPLAVYRFLARREVLTLCYHVVSDGSLPHVRHLYSYKTAAAFEQDLVDFKKRFHPIGYEELVAAHHGKSKLPAGSMILTFDDGYAECFSEVRPLLLKHEIPCVFFLTTDWVDNRRLFWRNKVSLCIERAGTLDDSSWTDAANRIRSASGERFETRQSFGRWIKSLEMDRETEIDRVCKTLGVDTEGFLASRRPYLTLHQVKRLAGQGFTIGAHTRSHPKLQLLDQDRAAEEIVESCKTVREWTGQRHVPFAFPFSAGGVGMDFLENLLSENEFIRFLFALGGMKRNGSFMLHRAPLDSPTSTHQGSSVARWLHESYHKEFKRRIRATAKSILGRVSTAGIERP